MEPNLLVKKKRTFKSCGNNCRVGSGFVVRGPQNISVGNYVKAGNNLTLETWSRYKNKDTGFTPYLEICSNVSIMNDCQISCANYIRIGHGVLIGNNVFITDNFHGSGSLKELETPPSERNLYSKGPVWIGDNVWIGRNVCIMPGITIGNGAIIGANAVVTHDIPENTIAVGVPARIIRIEKD